MDFQWIKDGLAKEGKTRSGLARALGLSPSAITALLDGSRRLRVEEVSRIASYLELDIIPPQLIEAVSLSQGLGPDAVKRKFDDVAKKRKALYEPVSIIGDVAGGVWTEPSLEFQPIPTEIARDTRWPPEAIYLLRVRGNSINNQARDGDLVLCLDVAAAPRKFRNGDWVIVERERGGLIETTVKRVLHAYNGEWMLEPDSDDKNFQEPIALSSDEDVQVRVRAFVLDFIRQGTRF